MKESLSGSWLGRVPGGRLNAAEVLMHTVLCLRLVMVPRGGQLGDTPVLSHGSEAPLAEEELLLTKATEQRTICCSAVAVGQRAPLVRADGRNDLQAAVAVKLQRPALVLLLAAGGTYRLRRSDHERLGVRNCHLRADILLAITCVPIFRAMEDLAQEDQSI